MGSAWRRWTTVAEVAHRPQAVEVRSCSVQPTSAEALLEYLRAHDVQPVPKYLVRMLVGRHGHTGMVVVVDGWIRRLSRRRLRWQCSVAAEPLWWHVLLLCAESFERRRPEVLHAQLPQGL